MVHRPLFEMSYLSYKFDQPETIRDRAKMNLASHHIRSLSSNYFKPDSMQIFFAYCHKRTFFKVLSDGILKKTDKRYSKRVQLKIRGRYSQTSRKRPPKMQTLGGSLWEVVTYESQNARVKFFRQPRMEWYIYSKKIMKVWFPLPITGNFIDKIFSYSMWQFIYGRALVRDHLYRISLKRLTNQKLTS